MTPLLIEQQQYDDAVAAPLTASYHGPAPDVEAAYLAEMVRQQALSQFSQEELYTSGLRIHVTLNGELQRAAVRALRDGLHEYDERHGWRGAEAKLTLPENPYPTPESATMSPEMAAAEADINGDAEAADTDPMSDWQPILNDLNGRSDIGNLTAVAVIKTDKQNADVLRSDGSVVTLTWDQLSWAAPYKDVEYVGNAPEQAADILSPGDVVRVRPVTIDDQPGWRLAQLPQVESALVSLDPQTGAVNALVGGYSFNQSHFNRVIQGQRQAGSAFKPFIYSSALLNGLTPATLINDAPIVFDDSELETAWRPQNSSGQFYGPTRLREALYRSRNIVSIRLLRDVGIQTTLDYLKQLKIPVNNMPDNLSLSLGSGQLTPMELARGLAVIANGGYDVQPYLIEQIQDVNGETIYEAPKTVLCDQDCESQMTGIDSKNGTDELTSLADTSKEPDVRVMPRLADERSVYILHSMMQDVIRRGTGRRAQALGRNDIAGKTGTTNEQKDTWFAGFNHDIATTTWVGFDQPAPLGRREFGASTALPIRVDYMKVALENAPSATMPRPNGIVNVRINPETGKRARPGEEGVFEVFKEEEAPAPLSPQDENERNGSADDDSRQIF